MNQVHYGIRGRLEIACVTAVLLFVGCGGDKEDEPLATGVAVMNLFEAVGTDCSTGGQTIMVSLDDGQEVLITAQGCTAPTPIHEHFFLSNPGPHSLRIRRQLEDVAFFDCTFWLADKSVAEFECGYHDKVLKTDLKLVCPPPQRTAPPLEVR